MEDVDRIAAFLSLSREDVSVFLQPSPGSLLLLGTELLQVGSVTPTRKADGSCVFLDEHARCRIHAVAPFGCAMFDTHMHHADSDERSLFLARMMMSPEYVAFRSSLARKDGSHE